jgi:hypothetical protein
MLSAIDIVKEINKQLENTWTEYEWKHGRKVKIAPEWRGRTKFVMEKYEKAGWKVRKEAKISSNPVLTEVYFVFQSPTSFKNCPSEIRGTGT